MPKKPNIVTCQSGLPIPLFVASSLNFLQLQQAATHKKQMEKERKTFYDQACPSVLLLEVELGGGGGGGGGGSENAKRRKNNLMQKQKKDVHILESFFLSFFLFLQFQGKLKGKARMHKMDVSHSMPW